MEGNHMVDSRIERRWARRTVVVLLLLNALLWGPFVLSAAHF
jgi:hypothetical protein